MEGWKDGGIKSGRMKGGKNEGWSDKKMNK